MTQVSDSDYVTHQDEPLLRDFHTGTASLHLVLSKSATKLKKKKVQLAAPMVIVFVPIREMGSM
jgi:hypothetical protein